MLRHRLADVLQTAKSTEQRAIAAWVIGYTSDKQWAARELVVATHDSDASVRNDAMRALSAVLDNAQSHPDVAMEVSADWFVDLLDSLVWTDRNKAMAVMLALTKDREEAVLSEMRERALPSLAEMARWTYEGHATMAFLLLGRAAQMTDQETLQAWQHGERKDVIARALKSEPARE